MNESLGLIDKLKLEAISLKQSIYFGPTNRLNDLCSSTRAIINNVSTLDELGRLKILFDHNANIFRGEIMNSMLKTGSDWRVDSYNNKSNVDKIFHESRFGEDNYNMTLRMFDDREKELRGHDLGMDTRESGEP